MDLISVIVPVYKVEEYLDQCVSSIVNQTYRNLEIILVDDGSPDQCPDMCDRWAEKDSRIKVIHKENGGLSDARNAGLKVATGEYVTFVDSDDWVKENFIQTLYETMIREQSDVVECGVELVDEDGVVMRTRACRQDCITIERVEALRRLVLEDSVYQTVWNKLYRANVIAGIFFEVGKYHEDDFWTYQVLEGIKRMTVLAEPMYCYLQRQQSIMGNGYSLKRLDGLEARVHRMKKLAEEPALKNVVESRIWSDFLYHYQCALRCLQGEDQKAVLSRVTAYMKASPKQVCIFREYDLKQFVWIRAFRLAPNAVARLRNRLSIGI